MLDPRIKKNNNKGRNLRRYERRKPMVWFSCVLDVVRFNYVCLIVNYSVHANRKGWYIFLEFIPVVNKNTKSNKSAFDTGTIGITMANIETDLTVDLIIFGGSTRVIMCTI